MTTFWEIAAHSVDHLFTFEFCLIVHVLLVISRFGFEGCIWVLIASVPDLPVCILLSLKFFPIVANDTAHSTNGVIGCRKNVQGYVVTFGAIGCWRSCN